MQASPHDTSRQSLREHAARAEAIARFASRLHAGSNLNALLQIICEQIAQAARAALVAVQLYDERMDALLTAAVHGRPPEFLAHVAPVPRSLYESLCRDMSFTAVDLTAAADYPNAQLYLECGARVLWCVEMRFEGRLVGVIELFIRGAEATASVGQLTLLTSFAGQAAQAITSARRLEDERTRADQLAALHKLGRALSETHELERIFELLYEGVCALLPDISAIAFSLFDDGRNEISCVFAVNDGERLDASEFPALPLMPPGQGTQSMVIHTRQPLIVDSLQQLHQRSSNVRYVGSAGAITQSTLFVPMLSKDKVVGVLQVQSYLPRRFDQAHADMLGLAGNVAAVAIENARLVSALQQSYAELRQAYDTTLEGWSRALDLRDEETEGHTRRVTDLTLRLARAAGLSEDQIAHVRRGALLHDIGKMGIPDAILHKPGPLTEDEWRIMRLHPSYANELLIPIAFLQPALAIPYCHHERWDGTGYPRGLRGEEIPLAARLFAVVDIWDALLSDRPYRRAWPEERVREHIRGLAGTHLDPWAVELFMQLADAAGPAEREP